MCGRYVITNAVSKTSKMVKTAIKVEDSENYNAHPCLLYTSPSPRDKRQSRMPSSA